MKSGAFSLTGLGLRVILSCNLLAVAETTGSTLQTPFSPQKSPETEATVPIEGGLLLHFRCHYLVLSYLLLDGQLLIALVFCLTTNVGNACFLILVNIEDFALPIPRLTLLGK